MIPIGILDPRLDPVALERRAAASSSCSCWARCSAPALGLVMGTLVPPNRINIVFSLVFTPLLFTGCSQYPWPSLDAAALVPGRHGLQPDDLRQRGDARRARPRRPAHPAADLHRALLLSLVVFSAIGIRGFLRQAVD